MPCADRLLGSPASTTQRAFPGAAEHEGRAETGGAAADHDAVIDHAATVAHRVSDLPSSLAELANDLDTHVRQRLRELRTERGLTLEAVAARAQIDVSTLSRLESGKRRLALDHVPALAAALGVSTDDLLTRAAAGPPGARAAADPRRPDDVAAHPPRPGRTACTPTSSASALTRREPPAELPTHEGHDWIYVLTGRMRLLLGDDDLVIKPGEAVEFSTWTPHWFGAVDGPVELIAIFGPHGERVHRALLMSTPITVYGDVDERAVSQLRRCADAGDALRGALCADGHVGYSQPIGGAVAYPDHISPSGVGYDIACGNKAAQTNLRADEIRPDLGADHGLDLQPDQLRRRAQERGAGRSPGARQDQARGLRSAAQAVLARGQAARDGRRRQPLRRPVRGRGRLGVDRRALRLARVRAQDRERVPRARPGAAVRRAREGHRDGQPAGAVPHGLGARPELHRGDVARR